MSENRRLSVVIATTIVLVALLTACPSTTPPVGNRAPEANAGPDQNVIIGNTVTLDAAGSTDEDDDALSFSWAFENRPAGSSSSLTGADTASPTFVADVAGAFVVTLSVNDGQTSATDSVTITASTTGVSNIAPALSAIEDQSAPRGTVIEVPFTITDEDPATVTVQVTSSDTTLIANADLDLLGSGADRSLRIALEQEGSGSAVITLNAQDLGGLQGSRAFTMTVTKPFETELPKLTASDAQGGDEFGYSVAMSGNSAVIGAPLDDDEGVDSGSAYLFRRSGDGWVQSMKLPPEPLVVAPTAIGASDRFGSSVAISSDHIIVGSPGDGDTTFEGAAHVYELCSRVCQEPATEMGVLTASDGKAGDAFGFSVAIDGDYALIGAVDSDDDGESSGSVYVFRRDGEVWTEVGEITANDASAFDFFGRSVAMSGDYAIVGASRASGAIADSGAAYMFRRSGDTWTEIDKVTASAAPLDSSFGWSVAIDGDIAIVGAIGDNGAGGNSGSAYVFQRSGDDWTEMDRLTASDSAAKDFFGISVAIGGDFALVGAIEGDGVGAGSAYVFLNRNGSWSEVNKLTASDAAEQDRFGTSVAISGDHAIVGANRSDDDGSDSGSVYVFLK